MPSITIQQAFETAVRLHQAGRLGEAGDIYRQILAREPQNVDALHLSGVIAHQAGKHDEAIRLIRQAIALRPNFVGALSNLGIALAAAGQADEAIAAYRQVIALHPKFPGVHLNLGIALAKKGEIDAAIEIYRQLIAEKRDHAEAYINLGNAMLERQQLEDAIAAFRQAIAINPRLRQGYNNLGNALAEARQFDAAIDTFHQVIKLSPNYAEAYSNLAKVLISAGRYADAIPAARTALSLNPNLSGACNNLGVALLDQGKKDEAISFLQRAIETRPGYAEGYYNLSNAFLAARRLDEALGAYKQAITLRPGYAKAQNTFGSILKDMGDLGGAIAAYREAIEFDPTDAAVAGNLLFMLHYHPDYTAEAIANEQRQWNDRYAEPLRKRHHYSNDRSPEQRLKIGYVSADLRVHPVGWFMLPLLQRHDRQKFEIFCYSNAKITDGMTSRLRPCADHWLDVVALTDEQLATRVAADGIDILVDLSGHSADNRLLAFAQKPAPVQVSYLGYPNSSGLAAIDYRLTDSFADPPGRLDHLYPEKLVRLPRTNWCFAAPEYSPAIESSPAERQGHITFGSFNNLAKVSQPCVKLWARILHELPEARLLLKSFAFASRAVEERMLNEFASAGISPERLILTGFHSSHASHLAAYNQLDIALDPFPYHGTTTTCDALWMGVPVVTLAGQTHVSRVGVSLLNNVRLPELVAESEDQYVQIAIDLAKDSARLGELRRTMRDRMKSSPLMDAEAFARDVEAAYRQMWRQWCESPAR